MNNVKRQPERDSLDNNRKGKNEYRNDSIFGFKTEISNIRTIRQTEKKKRKTTTSIYRNQEEELTNRINRSVCVLRFYFAACQACLCIVSACDSQYNRVGLKPNKQQKILFFFSSPVSCVLCVFHHRI